MLNKKFLIFILSFIPAFIWILNAIMINKVENPYWSELLLTGFGILLSAYVVTWSYGHCKFLSHKEREKIASGCFLNFLAFYICKEFRPDTGISYLSFQYGVLEAFMVMNAIYFSHILLLVFGRNMGLRKIKKR